jgi:hypothetical protein
VVFFGTERAKSLTPGMMKFPAPDLAVEILSESTAARDRGVKFEDYAAHGVAEYWILDAEQQGIEQYVARNVEFELTLKSASGEIASPTIAGLRLPIRAFFDREENLRRAEKYRRSARVSLGKTAKKAAAKRQTRITCL